MGKSAKPRSAGAIAGLLRRHRAASNQAESQVFATPSAAGPAVKPTPVEKSSSKSAAYNLGSSVVATMRKQAEGPLSPWTVTPGRQINTQFGNFLNRNLGLDFDRTLGGYASDFMTGLGGFSADNRNLARMETGNWNPRNMEVGTLGALTGGVTRGDYNNLAAQIAFRQNRAADMQRRVDASRALASPAALAAADSLPPLERPGRRAAPLAQLAPPRGVSTANHGGYASGPQPYMSTRVTRSPGGTPTQIASRKGPGQIMNPLQKTSSATKLGNSFMWELAKAIPFAGAIPSVIDAAGHFGKGNWGRGLLEAGLGALSFIPGVGTVGRALAGGAKLLGAGRALAGGAKALGTAARVGGGVVGRSLAAGTGTGLSAAAHFAAPHLGRAGAMGGLAARRAGSGLRRLGGAALSETAATAPMLGRNLKGWKRLGAGVTTSPMAVGQMGMALVPPRAMSAPAVAPAANNPWAASPYTWLRRS